MVVVVILIVLAKLLISEFAIASSAAKSDLYFFRCSNNIRLERSFENLHDLAMEASRTGFYKATLYGDLFALYMCRGDIGSQDCFDCVNGAADSIMTKCNLRMEAVIWYDHCMVRFSFHESFFGRMDESPSVYTSNSIQNVSGNQQMQFNRVWARSMNSLAVQAAKGDKSGKKFAYKMADKHPLLNWYALAQCTQDLTYNDCNRCLTTAINQLNISSSGSRSLLPSCNVRYDINPFFNQTSSLPGTATPLPWLNSTETSHSGSKKHGRVLHISVLIAASISITILIGVGIWICKYSSKQIKAFGLSKLEINEIRTMDSLQFDLNKIRVATRNFAMDNKLGEGGFGEVYKGILVDGQEIAIKRLSKNSGQGVVEFKTEVDLVANLQHKNLVRLLGFCFSSTEKILVYEFLQNSSLDQYIFDARKKAYLDWETRYKLIVGIGRGLLYLHEDSRLKIIHRDLKPSNILLDDDMNPKISDFGLAKLFEVDQTQGDTKRIVGTYGYMAPEYAMTGHFSVKSDVYSFGIIVLEIVSGERNRFFGQQLLEEAILYRAWRLWNEGKALNLVDTALDNKYLREEATKCIHIALLCIQENATERPRMATVVAALNGQTISLPIPKPPSFFGNITTTHEIPSANECGQVLDSRHCPYVYSGTKAITDDLYHPR